MSITASQVPLVQIGWLTVLHRRHFSLSSSDTHWSYSHWLPPCKPLSLQGFFPLEFHHRQLETKQAHLSSNKGSQAFLYFSWNRPIESSKYHLLMTDERLILPIYTDLLVESCIVLKWHAVPQKMKHKSLLDWVKRITKQFIAHLSV